MYFHFSRPGGPLFPRIALGTVAVAALLLVATASSVAQKAASHPDTIVFTNGNELSGKLVKVENGKATFHTDALGDFTVSLDKVESIRTGEPFAVIQEGTSLRRGAPRSSVPQGQVAVQNKNVTIGTGSQARVLPESQAQFIIAEPDFNKAVYGRHGWLNDWSGTLTAGLAMVEATQNSRTFNGSAAIARTVPGVDWMAPSYRTTTDFAATYGSVSSPGFPTVKTNIIHGGVEQDWFLSPRFFLLALASWDHNFSQGLALQQIYGAGLGYTVLKSPIQELDLKADAHFERQTFTATPGIVPPVVSPSKNLVGMSFGDAYTRKLLHGMQFNQTLSVTPAFNNVKAFSALGAANLLFPVYKRFSFNLGVQDAFLNDPGFGSKKNSFQFTAGLGYSF